MQNKGIYRNNKAGYVGVSRIPSGRYVAQLQVFKKNHYLGVFDTPELASEAYQRAKLQIAI
jgi:hypothetical protein